MGGTKDGQREKKINRRFLSDNVTLSQAMDYLGNKKNAFNIFGYWIFDSNNEKSLVITRESLDIVCARSVGEEQVTKSETVFYAIRYIHFTS